GAPEFPPLGGFLPQALATLVVWGLSFRWFGLYRPRRLGSRLSEWMDVAKASTLGGLVLIAVMAFAFPRHEYSRVVIVYFWALSIVSGSLWGAVFPGARPRARRRARSARSAS